MNKSETPEPCEDEMNQPSQSSPHNYTPDAHSVAPEASRHSTAETRELPLATPEGVIQFAKKLRDEYDNKPPSHIVSGQSLRYKCQKGWFTCICGLIEFTKDIFREAGKETPKEVLEFQINCTNPIFHNSPRTNETKIQEGNHILDRIISEMQKILGHHCQNG